MRRRDFITLLGGAAAAWPLAARAQQRGVPVVGFLNAQASARDLLLFRQGMREAGLVEGQNVAIEYQTAEGHYDRLPALAAELVRRQVAMIVSTGTDIANRAAKAATTTIPIVFINASDPVAAGLVASLSRPGGNITGVTNLGVELSQKNLELMHELLPAATEVAFLCNPNNPNAEIILRETQAAARILGMQLHVLLASTERDLDMAFANWAQLRAGPLVISNDAFFGTRSEQIGALVLRYAIPTVSPRESVAAGGLMSYGSDRKDMFRVVGGYAGRILKGEKPADLPVQQVSKVELIINIKTAKALGLTFPLTLLGRADEVIE
jgi:putative ABC transport system substrate-binding protein